MTEEVTALLEALRSARLPTVKRLTYDADFMGSTPEHLDLVFYTDDGLREFASSIGEEVRVGTVDDIGDPRGPRWWVTCAHHGPSLYLTAVGPHHAGVPPQEGDDGHGHRS